jgi:shikimate kinase
MEALRELGTVVWLRGHLEELCQRAQRGGERPMLAGRTPEDIQALYSAREPYYAQAHLSVDTTGLGPDQVVARLLAALRQADAARA